MEPKNIEVNRRQVARWLLLGVAMLLIQILIGGITRLTESGLSITEWKPITGMLPPLNDAQWQEEFAKYRTTDQFRYVHSYFGMKEFKFIFFWEWFHRFWARLMGIVFLVGFFYFLLRKKLSRDMVTPLIALFLLGALQGTIGWIMVKSGLVPQKYYVGHVELTTHFTAAMILLAYTLWFALSLLPSFAEKTYDAPSRKFLNVILPVFLLQLIYGGFMAGLKAATTAPTWPDINGSAFPKLSDQSAGWLSSMVNDPIAVQFIHRGFAYLLLILVTIFYIKTSRISSAIFQRFRKTLFFMMWMQVLLGILTVLNATFPDRLLWLGVSHQFTGMLIACCFVALFFLLKARKPAM